MYEIAEIDGVTYRHEKTVEGACSLICALLNGNGGSVCVSLDVDFQSVLDAITPKMPIYYHKVNKVNPYYMKGMESYLVVVPSGNDKPYSCDGRFYVLHDEVVVSADIDEIKAMLLAAQVSPLRWERWFADGIGPENFDADELRALAEKFSLYSEQETIARLEQLGLSRQGRFTNAADVLLCKDVALRNPQIRARAIACMDKTDDVYQGHETFEGPLLKVFNELNHFVIRHTTVGERFSEETPVRARIYQYPLTAIREGLINALVHRDYEGYAGTVKVEIYKDRLVISNAGGLYGGMTIEQLKAGHLSAFRNPDMANYLNIRGFMEMTGRGSTLIQKECQENGLPLPQWTADENSVTLTFFAKKNAEYKYKPVGGNEVGKEKSKGESKVVGKEKSKEKILLHLAMNPSATTYELAEVTGLSISGVEKNIRELKASGRLRRVGPDRGGHWDVVEP